MNLSRSLLCGGLSRTACVGDWTTAVRRRMSEHGMFAEQPGARKDTKELANSSGGAGEPKPKMVDRS